MSDATRPQRPSALAEFTAALIFLTRLPIPWRGRWPDDLDRRALAWFPIVGALIGAAGGLAFWGLDGIGLPPALSALLTVAGLMLLTGALHEDGLADVADGFGGGRDKARKLEIMKDSRVGTYGAAALVLSLATRVAALSVIAQPRYVALALIGAHAFSRGLLPLLKLALPDARATGLSAATGKPDSARALAALVVGFVFAATCLGKLALPGGGFMGLLVMAVAAGGVVLVGWLAQRQVGGVTGDVLGAAQQVSELAFLVGIVAALGQAA